MEPHDHRARVRQLADDLGWLEDHCRRQPDLAVHTAHLRLAAALTRNVVGPAIEGLPPRPLFVAVVGGAGSGKSTVTNFLVGAPVAEANPQAGYTRHPTAYVPETSAAAWPSYLGFLGSMQRLSQPRPGNLDEDVYQVRRTAAVGADDPLAEFVVWDCPDMTTWASSGYVTRLMEVVGLADVVVYVASDERYNDEVPTQFLHLVVKAGKAVVVCLTKVKEEDAAALTDHFRQEVLGRLPRAAGGSIPAVPVVVIPSLAESVRADPTGGGKKYRAQLVNQLLALCPSPTEARGRTVQNALGYLRTAAEGLLDVARRDLAELDAWKNLVHAGRARFEDRYRREFLAGESFRRFDRTREQVLEMLEFGGPGKFLSAVLALLRVPYRYARDFLVRLLARPDMPSLSEHAVCSGAMAAWLDGLQAEALRRAGTHPLWKQITHGFDSGLRLQAQDRYQQVFRTFEVKESHELDEYAKAVPERLANSPALLNTLRLAVVAFDLAAAGLVVWLTWPPDAYLLLYIPLAVSLSRQLTELLVRQVIESGRNRLRNHRESLVHESLSGPLAAWLSDWPSTTGTSLERLQLVLRRVPESIRDLTELVKLPADPEPPPAPNTP